MDVFGFALLSTLLLLTNGQNVPQNECSCMPHRFQAVVTALQTANAETFMLQELHAYFRAKRFATLLYSHNVTSGESTYLKRVITDFDTGKQYTFAASSNSSECVVRKANVIQPPQCITEPGAKFVGSTYLGSPYGPPLLVDTWRFSLEGPTANRTLTMGFADHLMAVHPACVPVFQAVSDTSDPESGQVMLFSSFKPTVNLSLFDIQGCPPL